MRGRLVRVIFVVVLAFSEGASHGQSPGDGVISPSPRPGANLKEGSTPSQDFRGDGGKLRSSGKTAISLRAGIVLLFGKDGGHGTGFVLSRERRLIATAAHVADHLALNNEGLRAYVAMGPTLRVERVWYHPKLVRRLDNGLYRRSSNPRDGSIAFRVPDVAVLELERAAELPCALDLASSAESRPTDGDRLDGLGFPGWIDLGWPDLNKQVEPRLESYTIVSATNFSGEPEVAPDRLTYLWHTEGNESQAGVSGGPLLLPNGHAVGVRSMAGLSIHVNCIRDICGYYGLDRRLAPRDGPKPGGRDLGDDPRLPELREAVALVGAARQRRAAKAFRSAIDYCDKALLIEPGYIGALFERSRSYFGYATSMSNDPGGAPRRQSLQSALEDSQSCMAQYREWFEPFMLNAEIRLVISKSDPRREEVMGIVKDLEKWISEDWRKEELSAWEVSRATNLMAHCFEALGNQVEARRKYDRSISEFPLEPQWYLDRAKCEEKSGDGVSASRDLWRGKTLLECDCREQFERYRPG